MVQPWAIMNFAPVVKPFGSTLKTVVLGYVMLGVVMLQPWSFMNFEPVNKLFDSTFKRLC